MVQADENMKYIFNYYLKTCRNFCSCLKKAPLAGAFFAAAFLTQPFIGYHFLGTWWGAVFYPIGNFIFISTAGVIIYHFTKNRKREFPEFRFQRLQILIIVLAVSLHFTLLLGQFPDENIAENPATLFLQNNVSSFLIKPVASFLENLGLPGSTVRQIGTGYLNTVFCVFFPLLLLLPFSRKKNEYFLSRLNIRLLLSLFLMYVPFFFIGNRSLNTIFIFTAFYFFQAALPEEFLYRALLQARLQSLVRNKLNAIVTAALVFGLMHLPVNSRIYGWPLSIAFCIGGNAFGGFLIGYLFYRTRSLGMAILYHLWSGTALQGL